MLGSVPKMFLASPSNYALLVHRHERSGVEHGQRHYVAPFTPQLAGVNRAPCQLDQEGLAESGEVGRAYSIESVA